MATNVYQRMEGGQWRMLAHHASLPLIEPDRDEGPAAAAPLH